MNVAAARGDADAASRAARDGALNAQALIGSIVDPPDRQVAGRAAAMDACCGRPPFS